MIKQPDLQYRTDALKNVISEDTIYYHYGIHEKAYIRNVNELIAGTELEHKCLADIIKQSDGALFNNAAQAWNHIFYFNCFSAHGSPHIPKGLLRNAIEKQFGSVEKFKILFENMGTSLFGSGWIWLSKDENKKLILTQGINADNPLTKGFTPLLCFDVWEHAYYLDYKNRRDEYIHKLWNIVDWTILENRFISK